MSLVRDKSAASRTNKHIRKIEEESDSDLDVYLELAYDSDMDCSIENGDINDEDTECMFCLGRQPDDAKGEQWIRYC